MRMEGAHDVRGGDLFMKYQKILFGVLAGDVFSALGHASKLDWSRGEFGEEAFAEVRHSVVQYPWRTGASSFFRDKRSRPQQRTLAGMASIYPSKESHRSLQFKATFIVLPAHRVEYPGFLGDVLLANPTTCDGDPT